MPSEKSAFHKEEANQIQQTRARYVKNALHIANAILEHGLDDARTREAIRVHSLSMRDDADLMKKSRMQLEGLANKVEKALAPPRMVALHDYLFELGVPHSKLKLAAVTAKRIIQSENSSIAPYAIPLTRGYRMIACEEAENCLRSALTRKGLLGVSQFYRARGFIALDDLADRLGVKTGQKREARAYMAEFMSKSAQAWEGNLQIRRGRGYLVKPSDEVLALFRQLLQNKGFIDRKGSSFSIEYASAPEHIKEGHYLDIDGKPLRISAAALDQGKQARELWDVQANGYSNIGDKLVYLVKKAATTGGYRGINHESLTYKDPQGTIVDFRIAHGTVTDITVRKSR